MFNLVYRSTANPIFGNADIADMLAKAREFNHENNITGCLLFYHGEFLQYLEGKESIVLDLFSRIMEDSRHSKIQLLSSGHIYRREFTDWDMAYEDFLGGNHQLQYLKLLLSAFIETPEASIEPIPTSKKFWVAVKQMLKPKPFEKLK